MDSNHRPSGYEPDELPLLHAAMVGARTYSPSGHPASTFGAAAFHDPVRDGTGWIHGASRTPLAQGPVPRPSVFLVALARLLSAFLVLILARPAHVFPQGSPRPCAPVASTRRRASSSSRLPSHLLGDLPA